MPFDEEEQRPPKKGHVSVKSDKKTIFDKQPKKPKQSDFSDKVFDIEKKRNVVINNFSQAVIEIKRLFSDKTLPQNKHSFSESLENEVIQKFIDLCIEKNDDENSEHYGEGSLSAFSLLIKLCLVQKDRINILEKEIYDIKLHQNKKEKE